MIFIGTPIDIKTVQAVLAGPITVALSANAQQKIIAGEQALATILAQHRTVYGINTGFGLLAEKRISDDDLAQLQLNLVLSHACGTGNALPPEIVRLILFLKIQSLAQGFSGVRLSLVQALIELLNRDLLPEVPAQGSVGASGDLAPLAHLSAALLGLGRIWDGREYREAAAVLQQHQLSAFTLGPKEGLALLNGTQVSTSIALAGLVAAGNVFAAALVAGAMSVDAAMGSDAPFDPRIHAVRPHAGQRDCAAAYRKLLHGSEIRASHLDCQRVQDPYSLRCQPQVMGAVLDQMRYVHQQLICEANSVTDNPLLFPESCESISGGNFHAEPVAFAADALAVAIAEIGSLSERRLSLLIDRHLSGLPPFLVQNGGVNSGFMIAQVTAAALVSENKCLAHPSSVDSLPTSANQEDHVSMATYGARRTVDMARNASVIVGIELLAAAQGIEFRRPLKSSPALEVVHHRLRQDVPVYENDRWFAADIEHARLWIASGQFLANLEDWSGLPTEGVFSNAK